MPACRYVIDNNKREAAGVISDLSQFLEFDKFISQNWEKNSELRVLRDSLTSLHCSEIAYDRKPHTTSIIVLDSCR